MSKRNTELGSSQDNYRKAEAEFNHGIICHEKGDNANAIKHLTKAINLRPERLSAYYYNHSLIYLSQGDYNKAIEINTNVARIYNNRGSVYVRLKEHDKAIADYDKAIQLNPYDTLSHYNRGLIYASRDEYDKAIADYDKAIQLNPYDAQFYYERGVVHYSRGYAYSRSSNLFRTDHNDYTRAMEDYDKAIQLNPNDAMARYKRSLLWLEWEMWEKAELDLTFARDNGLDIVHKFFRDCGNSNNYVEDIAAKFSPRIRAMLMES